MGRGRPRFRWQRPDSGARWADSKDPREVRFLVWGAALLVHGQSLLARVRVYSGDPGVWGMKDLLFWTLGIRGSSLELAAVQPRISVISPGDRFLCGRSSCKWAAWARVGMRRARIRTNTSCIGKPWGALGCTKPRANSLLSPSSPQGRSAQRQKVHKCAGADIRIALFSYSPCLESHSDRRNGKIGARGPICPLRLSECDSKQGEQENRVIRVQGW